MAKKESYSSAQLTKFILPSLIAAIAFIMPIPQDGTYNTILGIVIDFGKTVLKSYLPMAAMIFVVLSALVTVLAVAARPKFITESEFLREIFVVTPFWLLSRLLGGALYILIIFHIGPEVIWNMDNGGTPGIVLAPALLIIFLVLAAIVPFLTDYGLMEYVGTFARPLMRPLFKLPGRAAVDCLASWIGSSSVAVVITTKVHDQGYYTDREGAIISTTFSVISIAYIYVMADFVKLPHMYFQILISIYIVTFLLAIIMPRIWPLSSIPDTFSGKAGKQRIGDEIPEGYKLGDWALKLAVDRAAKQTPAATVAGVGKTLVSLVVGTMPLVISWGTVVLIIANNTPIFNIIATPFTLLLNLMRIPEAGAVGTAFVLSFADQFLAAVVGAGAETDAARFMCAGISATGLVYMTEVGVLILNSSIPLNFIKLTCIYIIRAVLTIFLLAPFAWYFTM
ncbi:MAG: YjiH family protein [Synergistaceae bacterium]|jgi:nucleoside recognition membrane protein YjiH|nr:YjiH family protein [Synergistaceae bacterium]